MVLYRIIIKRNDILQQKALAVNLSDMNLKITVSANNIKFKSYPKACTFPLIYFSLKVYLIFSKYSSFSEVFDKFQKFLTVSTKLYGMKNLLI